MTEKKEMLFDLLQATRELDEALKWKIEENWNLKLMIEALNQLVDEYKRHIEENEKYSKSSAKNHARALLTNKLFEILRLESILQKTDKIPPSFKEDLVEIILDYYGFIGGFKKEDEEVKA